nr:WecB/TagA/CpsF family glycosyltransferase [Clostridia bacterium]
MDEAVARCDELINSTDGPHTVHTPNSEIVQLCIDAPEHYELINSASLIIPDGSGVILASKILKTPLTKGKVAGVELGENLAKLASEKGYSLFLLGGKPANAEEGIPCIAEEAARKLTEKYPGLTIAGTNDGYFKDDAAIIEKINESGADILFVCTGVPRQEKWMAAHKAELKVKLMLGLGGSLDIYSGTSKRAPKIFIKLGLEWFYRLLKEPWRIGRMMKLPKFLFGTMFAKRK